MDLNEGAAIRCLQALAQPTRLQAFRQVVQRGPEGTTPGWLSEHLGVPAQTLSFHLKELSSAELISSRREGRSIRYFPRFDTVRAVAGYLMENCCDVEAPRRVPARSARRGERP